jgi:aminoglycoside phosphotransferase (APT) family kinase protein
LAERHTALGQALAHRSDLVRVPALVGLDANAGLLAVEWDRGDPLLDVLKHDGSAIDDFVSALRTFHAAQVPDLPTLTPDQQADSISATVQELVYACPALADSLTAIGEDLRRRLGEVGAAPAVTLHNDLHPRQVHLKRGRFTFLDLERLAKGDPLIDIANFAVQLSILPHRREAEVEPADAERWREALLTSWSRQSGLGMDAQRFHLLAAAFLLKLAHGAMRHLRPEWHDTVHACVRMANHELGLRCVGAAVP